MHSRVKRIDEFSGRLAYNLRCSLRVNKFSTELLVKHLCDFTADFLMHLGICLECFAVFTGVGYSLHHAINEIITRASFNLKTQSTHGIGDIVDKIILGNGVNTLRIIFKIGRAGNTRAGWAITSTAPTTTHSHCTIITLRCGLVLITGSYTFTQSCHLLICCSDARRGSFTRNTPRGFPKF